MSFFEVLYLITVFVLAGGILGTFVIRYVQLPQSFKREAYATVALATAPGISAAALGLPLVLGFFRGQAYFFLFQLTALTAFVVFAFRLKSLLDVREEYLKRHKEEMKMKKTVARPHQKTS
jgi:hypothetical protein